MEILSINVLRGPNYWSNTRCRLIVIKLHLHEYERLPTNTLPGFYAHLSELLPSLHEHYCSENHQGGFLKRVNEGTWLGHVIEHVALELQWLAGMECGFGRTRSTAEPGVYHVVFSYVFEKAGVYAAYRAVELVRTLACQKKYLRLAEDIRRLRSIRDEESLGPSTQAILTEAERRNIPFRRLDSASLIQLGHGRQQKQIRAAMTSDTSSIGVDNASDKELTKNMLAAELIPVPQGVVISGLSELDAALKKVGFPCVIKPLNGNHGRGATTHILTKEKARAALNLAQQVSSQVIVEHLIDGHDYRFLVVNYQLVAVAQRSPAAIVGDGTSTIQQLIDAINQQPERGRSHENYLTAIAIDDVTMDILKEKNLDLDGVLSRGTVLRLKHAANISSGGTSTDVTADVHPANAFMAERIARLMKLDVCGIDIMAQDIRLPIEGQGAVLEVNASPGLRMHLRPTQGQAIDVAKPILDMLFPNNQSGRIPLVAVTGTNGKTTTVRLMAHFAREAGHQVGFTTTDAVYINQNSLYLGDCSGPFCANLVLRDPLVDFAVLECARGGILRAGLGFDQCQVSIITNVSSDHLGQNDIHTLSDMARVKEVVARSTAPTGYAVLNADDELVFAMKQSLTCQIALFSMHKDNQRIDEHCRAGGLAAYIDSGRLIIRDQDEIITLQSLEDIPITHGGKASCMIQNALAATLAAVAMNFKKTDIAAWLTTFYPTPEMIPGRMNVYSFNQFKVMLDYCHNEAAFIELQKYLKQLKCTKKIGIIAATGDRSTDDIKKVGSCAAQMYHEIIIRHDSDGRGRSNEELTELIVQGIDEAESKLVRDIQVIPNEKQALSHALARAKPGTFIVYFPEDVLAATAHLKTLHKEWNADYTSA
ncbi:cyanophycin synthetase [Legionella taurinensis]|uniref:Cyanophycin synthetase n=2 Tax=Gammaproteobacteria TaxID=1236 RepID=A0AB38N2K5_9GAMM|nr:cyanophycin synthetase [Legionella taurinensis]MDX1838780.1 cyanophycin synthetase [Legionella taurinensis]PUT38644.1 cyanophycin synthetase [Legionella taurinensis]PUT39842.1 cyanophycin synthetase [Legionella taurinensis]PUT41834.1 cyanophycin synthetase [Legionella taurinensis]PUT45329.1 cyanophycin synthetase [Legionella taurinensis]